MSLVELKEYVCVNCGGKIDRNTLRCLYCDTQYERRHEEKQPAIKPFVGEYDGRGVQRLCASVKMDNFVFTSGEMTEDRIKDMLCKSLARAIRDYIKISIMDDDRSFSKVANGMIMVVDTR